MRMEEALEEEAPLEEAQKEAIRLNEALSKYLDESVVYNCVVSKHSIRSFSQEESEFCWR